MLFVFSPKELINRAEQFLVPGFIRALNHSDWEKWSLHFSSLEDNLVRFRKAFKLVTQIVPKICTSQWAHSCISFHGIAKFNGQQFFNQLSSKCLIVLFINDESFWREANLTSIGTAPSNCLRYSVGNISICQYNKRIISTQFHNSFFKILSSFFSYQSTTFRRPCEADSLNSRMLENLVNLLMTRENVLILSIIQSSLYHYFLHNSANIWTRISISCQKNVAEQQAWEPSFEVEIEGVIEWGQIVDSSNRKIFYKSVFFCLCFNLLRQNRLIVLAVVLAEFDSLIHLSFSIGDRFSHLGSDDFSGFFEPLLNGVSQILNKLSSLLNSSVSVDLKGCS